MMYPAVWNIGVTVPLAYPMATNPYMVIAGPVPVSGRPYITLAWRRNDLHRSWRRSQLNFNVDPRVTD
jgi:hypothetical protein